MVVSGTAQGYQAIMTDKKVVLCTVLHTEFGTSLSGSFKRASANISRDLPDLDHFPICLFVFFK